MCLPHLCICVVLHRGCLVTTRVPTIVAVLALAHLCPRLCSMSGQSTKIKPPLSWPSSLFLVCVALHRCCLVATRCVMALLACAWQSGQSTLLLDSLLPHLSSTNPCHLLASLSLPTLPTFLVSRRDELACCLHGRARLHGHGWVRHLGKDTIWGHACTLLRRGSATLSQR